jgi:23S rRNA pseudouridine1911/1915/1917 synthase
MLPLRRVFEDRWLIVIDKPSGVPTQEQRGGRDPSVERRLRDELGGYVALHHRLDQPASGLLVLSKHQDANPGLAAAFRAHAVLRTYLAVLAGSPTPTTQTLTDPIDGQPARTELQVVGHAGGLVAVVLRPQTGRKHQLRRHTATHGRPMLGDQRYGGDVGRWHPRLALHAARLQLTHPVTGERLDLHAPLPPDLEPLWRLAGGPDADGITERPKAPGSSTTLQQGDRDG